MRTLTPAEALANAAHHHSLSRPGTSIEAIAAELVGLHNTSPVGPYLSLRARLPGFDRMALDALMWDRWQVARFRAMRLTLFVFPHDLLEVAAAATRRLSESWASRWLRDSGLSQREFERLAKGVTEALADGPLTARALRRALGVPTSVDLPGVVSRMCDAGKLVGGAPPRSWRSPVRRYHLWHDVLPDVDIGRWKEHAAVGELIRRYVTSYGPVTIDDISWWTGLTKGRCRAALATFDTEQVEVDAWPGPLYRTTGPPVGTDPGSDVTALPLLDPYVQGYRDRVRFLHPGLADFVYDRGGNSTATLVHRGRIIGVWQLSEEPGESLRYHLFAGGPARVRREAEEELEAAGSLYFDRPVEVVEYPTMTPLSADGGRSASHPLDSRIHRASRRQRGVTRPLPGANTDSAD